MGIKIEYIPPCTYQGGKQRLAEDIVKVLLEEGVEDSVYYDLCCGSGAISLGLYPYVRKVLQVDAGNYDLFWEKLSKKEFDIQVFKEEIDKIPINKEEIQGYLTELSKRPVENSLSVYHYLILQAGAFGGKQIWSKEGKWCNNTFKGYWQPTETSNRRSPVNPMAPMPASLLERTQRIVSNIGGKMEGYHKEIQNLDIQYEKDAVVYIDPPYENTQKYGFAFDYKGYIAMLLANKNVRSVVVSEGKELEGAQQTICLSKGRKKGNISGSIKKKPSEEWLNIFRRG